MMTENKAKVTGFTPVKKSTNANTAEITDSKFEKSKQTTRAAFHKKKSVVHINCTTLDTKLVEIVKRDMNINLYDMLITTLVNEIAESTGEKSPDVYRKYLDKTLSKITGIEIKLNK